MNQGGRKPRPIADQSDDAFDAKTVIRPNPSRPSLDDDDDASGEKTKFGSSSLDQAFGERTTVMPSRAAGIPPQPPPPPPREPRAAPEARIPNPPPRARPQAKPEPAREERFELSEATQWNSQISQMDVTNPDLEPVDGNSFKDMLAAVPKNAKIIGGAVIFLVAVFAITRFTGQVETDSGHETDADLAADVVKHGSSERPRPAVTPPQQQAMGSESGVPVETVLQQFDQAFFATQSQARGQ